MPSMRHGRGRMLPELVLGCECLGCVGLRERTVAWTTAGRPAGGGDRAREAPDGAEFEVRVAKNALGFRERAAVPTPAGVVRIVALGDPFTQGYAAPQESVSTRSKPDCRPRARASVEA